jgi:hypothetical protein
MRRDRTAARILLILSVVHLAVAAPAIVRQRHLNVAKDVTPALGKRGDSDEDSSHLLPQMGNDRPSTSGTSPSQDGLPPTSGIPPSLDDTPPGSGTPQSQDDLSPTSGAPPLHDNPPPVSGTPQLPGDPPPTPGAPLLQDDTSSVSGNSQLHSNDPPEAGWYSESPTSSDDLSWYQGESSEVPRLSLLQQIDWNYFGETPQPEVEPLGESSGTSESLSQSSTTSGALQLQNDPPPASHDGSGEFDSSYRWLNDLRHIEGGASPSESPPPPPPTLPGSPGIVDTVFNDARKQKLKVYTGLGTIVGVSVGLVYGLQKLIEGTDPQAYVSALFPPTFNQVTNNLTYDLPQ